MTAGPIARGAPLREQVRERLVEGVLAGRWPAGSALTEASLARELDVSRTPVREALLLLEGEGVLESATARGFVVRGLSRREADDLYPVLAALEQLAARSITGLDPATRERLAALAQDLAQCEDPGRRWSLDSAWHDTLTAASTNASLARLAGQVRTSLSRYELTYMATVTDRRRADDQHQAILAALTGGDTDRAARLVAQHWDEGHRAVITAITTDLPPDGPAPSAGARGRGRSDERAGSGR